MSAPAARTHTAVEEISHFGHPQLAGCAETNNLLETASSSSRMSLGAGHAGEGRFAPAIGIHAAERDLAPFLATRDGGSMGEGRSP
jgi:hypothetical protein